MKSTISRFIDLRAFCAGVALIVLSSCSNESTSVPSNPQLGVYIQLDRIGRPGVKEIFESFADHDSTNRNSPYKDQVLPAAIVAFTAGRSNAVQTAAGNVFGVDELQLNTEASGSAGYLDLETGNSSGFGGRGLSDDVMDTDLNAAFGASLVAGDTAGGNVCLITDNVGSQATADNVSTNFPYVGKPH